VAKTASTPQILGYFFFKLLGSWAGQSHPDFSPAVTSLMMASSILGGEKGIIPEISTNLLKLLMRD
jgi:hypothetical protein